MVAGAVANVLEGVVKAMLCGAELTLIVTVDEACREAGACGLAQCQNRCHRCR